MEGGAIGSAGGPIGTGIGIAIGAGIGIYASYKAGEFLHNVFFKESDEAKSAPPNPHGQQGAPDHQEEVQKQTDKAQAGAKPGETVLQGQKIQGVDSTRRPDVQVVKDGKTERIVEVERRPNSKRNLDRQKEYDRLKIPHETVPLPKRVPPPKDPNAP